MSASSSSDVGFTPMPTDDGTPPIVFLHPVGLDARMWQEIGAALPAPFQTHALDLPGHGDADRLHGDFSLADMAGEVRDQITDTWPNGVVLVGASMGGMVAQIVALDAPRLVRGLVLADTVTGAPPSARATFLARAQQAQSGGMAAVLDDTMTRWFSTEFQRRNHDVVQRVRGWLLEADPEAHAQCWRAIADFDVGDRAGELSQPVLVVCGSEDISTPPALAHEITRLVRHAQYREIPGAGHMAPLECPAHFARLLDEFVTAAISAPRGRKEG